VERKKWALSRAWRTFLPPITNMYYKNPLIVCRASFSVCLCVAGGDGKNQCGDRTAISCGREAGLDSVRLAAGRTSLWHSSGRSDGVVIPYTARQSFERIYNSVAWLVRCGCRDRLDRCSDNRDGWRATESASSTHAPMPASLVAAFEWGAATWCLSRS